ncbi:MAG: ferritin-like domain-containing protein [Firmicutes bacterium]|nr:ferritin-like domain-containing protein [Bacillota bacterium]
MAKNNASEQEAIEGYTMVLNTPGYPQELYTDIREIISDEMNHSQKLSHWVTKLTGIQPAKD